MASASTPLPALLDRLAAIKPTTHPFISLYLNAQPDDRGRDRHETFVRAELGERAASYIDDAEARASVTRDLDRIQQWLATELQPSANGAAIFACSAASVFEAAQLAAPIDENLLFIGDRPHLYPLARLDARYPRYAALVCDTSHARIFVFAAGTVEKVNEIDAGKTRRHDMGAGRRRGSSAGSITSARHTCRRRSTRSTGSSAPKTSSTSSSPATTCRCR